MPPKLSGAEIFHVPKGADWSYFKGTEAPSTPADAWHAADFDDAHWPVGPAPFGFDNRVEFDFGIELVDMQSNYLTLFTRRAFEVPDPSAVNQLELRMYFEDGFVAWINGHEVYRDNVHPGEVTFDVSGTPTSYEPEDITFPLPDPSGYLVAGTNHIAVVTVNRSLASSDFMFELALVDPDGVDEFPPVITSTYPLPDGTVRTLDTIQVTFDEPITGLDASDLLINGEPAQAVSGDGEGPYTFTCQPPAAGPANITWAAGHGITDISPQNNAFSGAPWQYTIDPNAPLGDLVLNEIMASNATALLDEDGDSEDWIEIYNRGAQSISLAGWSLSNDPTLLEKWMLPDVTLDAQAYLLVFASGKDRRDPAGELHTHFQLDRAGEFLALVSPENAVVSAFDPGYPEQKRDHSYGIDAGGALSYFIIATPGEPNSAQTAEGLVKAPRFTPDHGLFYDPVSVSLTTTTPGATILYRMDPEGRALTEADGTVYDGTPLTLEGEVGRAVFNIRAMAVKPNHIASDVVSRSYIFPDMVLQQPTRPDGGFPTSWANPTYSTITADYQLDPDILNQPEYREMAEQALAESPSLMLTMDVADLFLTGGLYVNANQDCPTSSGAGCTWERPCSAEMIYPENHKGFQVNCGIRMQGQTSRHADWKVPKYSFRLTFRDDYGPTRLRFPLFPDSHVTEFDTLVLDAKMNQTWVHPSTSQTDHAQYAREIVCDDWQNMMGSYGAHNIFVNLYVNGLHWGLYNIHERCDHNFAASYMGGNGDDYDCLKHDLNTVKNPDPPDHTRATQSWSQMYAIISSGTVTNQDILDIQPRLDLPDLCDYILMNLYAGNSDWAHKNWYATHYTHDGQWRYHSWDAEHVLKINEVFRSVINYRTVTGGPTTLFDRLRTNAEFRLIFADRAHRHFYNGGVFYVNPASTQWNPAAPDNNMPAKQYMKRIEEIDKLIVMESARWGDYRRPSNPYDRDDWLNELNGLLTSYFPRRSQYVLSQLRSAQLYPNVDAPVFSQHGGDIQAGDSLTMTNPEGSGTIYYTLDGTDPREFGTGDVADAARAYSAPVALNSSRTVKARLLRNSTWSALNEAEFQIPSPYRHLQITEIMYNPPEGNLDAPGFYEFLELKNTGSEMLDLTGLKFTEGILYEFPQGAGLAPGRFFVLAADGSAFAERYPGIDHADVYLGRLDDDGDRITLADSEGAILQSFAYHDAAWWATEPDGGGYSLVPEPGQPDADLNRAEAWMPSRRVLGSPGADDDSVNPEEPVIIKHPEDVTLNAGQTATFSVVAAYEGTPQYQWQKDGADIAGAEQASYRTPPLQASDSQALFTCIVSNGGHQATSHPAKVTVLSAGVLFLRGDTNGDNARDLADAITALQYLFTNGELDCQKSADTNDDGKLDLGDPINLLTYLFTDPSPLPAPFTDCGTDATDDDLTCDRFPPCE